MLNILPVYEEELLLRAMAATCRFTDVADMDVCLAYLSEGAMEACHQHDAAEGPECCWCKQRQTFS